VQGAATITPGVLKFYSKDELRRYLKLLVERYQAASEEYGDQLGALLRTIEQQKGAKVPETGKKVVARGWVKMGSLTVNSGEPNAAMAELLFQSHEEAKSRLAKVTEATKSFEDLSSSTIPEAGVYYLQLKNGVPDRIVADTRERDKSSFAFKAEFQLI
jgi:hypothetical protein